MWIKNQIYIGIGIAGNLYLGYVAIRLMQNGVWLGHLICSFSWRWFIYYVKRHLLFY